MRLPIPARLNVTILREEILYWVLHRKKGEHAKLEDSCVSGQTMGRHRQARITGGAFVLEARCIGLTPASFPRSLSLERGSIEQMGSDVAWAKCGNGQAQGSRPDRHLSHWGVREDSLKG